MKACKLVVMLVGCLLLAQAALAQTPVRVRGTITALDGNVLSVKSRDGRDLRIALTDGASVAVAKAVKFEDIKQGDYVGATTKPGPDGTLVAIEVHYLPPTAPDGHIDWDLQPNTKMTNANVNAIVQAAGKRELTLQYKGGTQKIVVPESAALVRSVPGTRSDLIVGEYVFIGAQSSPDGALSASRVQVGKDGVRPPQ